MPRLPPLIRDPLKGLYYRAWPNLVWIVGHDDCEWWVVSHGGVKTTMVMEFLARHGTVNNAHIDPYNLKHLGRPPWRLAPQRMFVYIYGDPVRSVLSLYRRQYAQAQARKLGYLGGVLPPTVDGYAERGSDALRLTHHLMTWMRAHVDVPIAYVDSERLWTDVPGLLTQLGVEATADQFPAEVPRSTDLDSLGAATRQRLESIYGPYRALVRDLPAVSVRPPVVG